MKTILGIDVGAGGALAIYDGEELIIYDMPVLPRNKTKRVCAVALKEILSLYKIDHAYIEQVNAFGMGATSAYNFGFNCAIPEAVVMCLNIPITYVTPQKWKRAMQCPKDKNAARARATQLLPQFAHNWDLKKHVDRCEASLIALYGYRQLCNHE